MSDILTIDQITYNSQYDDITTCSLAFDNIQTSIDNTINVAKKQQSTNKETYNANNLTYTFKQSIKPRESPVTQSIIH